MIKYDLVKRTAEFNRQNRKEIKEGCTALDPDPEYIKTFDDLEEAKKELAKRKTSVSKFENHNMTFYSVEKLLKNPAMKQLVFIPAWKRRKRQQTSMTETESPI